MICLPACYFVLQEMEAPLAVASDSTVVLVTLISSVASIVLASITAFVSIWNNRIVQRTEANTARTEHTVNSARSALEEKVETLKTLVAAKDETIRAQTAPAQPAQVPPPEL